MALQTIGQGTDDGALDSRGSVTRDGNRMLSAEVFFSVPAPVVVDEVAPTVTNVSPTADTAISASTPLVCDVADETSFRRIIIAVQNLSTGVVEVAWDGVTFTAPYRALSSAVAIAGGYRVSLARTGGWTGPPRRIVYAIDRGGNEA